MEVKKELTMEVTDEVYRLWGKTSKKNKGKYKKKWECELEWRGKT